MTSQELYIKTQCIHENIKLKLLIRFLFCKLIKTGLFSIKNILHLTKKISILKFHNKFLKHIYWFFEFFSFSDIRILYSFCETRWPTYNYFAFGQRIIVQSVNSQQDNW